MLRAIKFSTFNSSPAFFLILMQLALIIIDHLLLIEGIDIIIAKRHYKKTEQNVF